MRAGKLRHLVTINRYTPTTSAVTGEKLAGYTAATPQVWAEIVPLSGRELLNAQQIVTDSTHQIRMRYTANVSHRDQILFNGRTFEIDAMNNTDERNIELVMLAHEAVG